MLAHLKMNVGTEDGKKTNLQPNWDSLEGEQVQIRSAMGFYLHKMESRAENYLKVKLRRQIFSKTGAEFYLKWNGGAQ